MSQEFFSTSTSLKDVKFGLMGYVPIDENQFSTWRTHQKGRLIIWSDEVERGCLPMTISEFEVVENFLLGKMMFVGGGENKNWNRPVRGEFTPGIPVSFDFLPDQEDCEKIHWNWSVLFTYYKRYEALIVFLYSPIPKISVDQLIFLRNLNWYPEDKENRWKMECINDGTQLGSIQALFNHVLTASLLGDKKIDNNCPIFSFMELQAVGPSNEILSFPKNRRQLSAAEHYGLFSGDEGYRLVNLHLPLGALGNKPGDALASFDPKLTFSGRRHFAYQFSPTSCLAFMAEDVAAEKAKWEKWYSENVCNAPILLRYIRLASTVPCLSDGIPVLIEICMLRYAALVKVEKEIRTAAKRDVFCKAVLRMKNDTALDKATRQIEELDLYQDSALWVIGGTYTDSLFNYLAIRARIDRAKQSLQISESENIRTVLALVGILIAIAIASLGLFFKRSQDIPHTKIVPPTALSNSQESPVRAAPVSVALPVDASLHTQLPAKAAAPVTMRKGQ